MNTEALFRSLAALGIEDCTCTWAWKSLGRLDGIDMGKGWVRITDDPECPHHRRGA